MKRDSTVSLIQAALREDCFDNDITTKLLIAPRVKATAKIVAKSDCIVCGMNTARMVFKAVDAKLKVKDLVKDGQKVKAGTALCEINGSLASVLKAERTALNFLAHLSGVSTLTRQFVDQVKGYKVQILDTRKTTPGLRELEKYAVRCGGGRNHRMNLEEMVLIKDNHREAFRKKATLSDVVRFVRTKTRKLMEIEVNDLKQFHDALRGEPDFILLDNMSCAQMKQAVQMRRNFLSKVILEASGGVNMKSVRNVAATGVDRISVGALTHASCYVDISMDVVIT